MRRWLPNALLALAMTAALAAAEDVVLHVAPDGRDDWSGRVARPAADGTDGPLATLAGARDAIRSLKAGGELAGAGSCADPGRILCDGRAAPALARGLRGRRGADHLRVEPRDRPARRAGRQRRGRAERLEGRGRGLDDDPAGVGRRSPASLRVDRRRPVRAPVPADGRRPADRRADRLAGQGPEFPGARPEPEGFRLPRGRPRPLGPGAGRRAGGAARLEHLADADRIDRRRSPGRHHDRLPALPDRPLVRRGQEPVLPRERRARLRHRPAFSSSTPGPGNSATRRPPRRRASTRPRATSGSSRRSGNDC